MTTDVEFVDLVAGGCVEEYQHYSQPIPRQGDLVAFDSDHYRVIGVKHRPEYYQTVVYVRPTDRTEPRGPENDENSEGEK